MATGRPPIKLVENEAWEVRAVSLGTQPGLAAAIEGVAVDARRLYLTYYLYNPQQPTVSLGAKLVVLDADTLATLAEVPVGGRPRGVAVSPNRNRIFVAGAGPSSQHLAVINAANFAQLPSIQYSSVLLRIALSTARSRAYITNPSQGVLHVADDTSGASLAMVIVGTGATGVAIDDTQIYVTLAGPATGPQNNALIVINANNNIIVRTVPIPPDQSRPMDVAVLPGIKRIFVANLGMGSGSGAVPSPRLTVLNRDNFTAIGDIPLPAPVTHLAADVVRNKVYATTSAGLLVIDGALNRIIAVVSPEQPTLGVAVSQSTGQIIIGDPAGGKLRSAVQSSANSFDLTLLRPDDLLHLDYEFVNLKLLTAGGAPRLTREVAGQPAFVVVHFPAQSIAEQANELGAAVRAPVPAVLAGRSRLVFRVPDSIAEIPYTVEGLLDWSRFEPSLHPTALAPGSAIPTPPPSPSTPLPTHTAIELPYRLVLSPDNTATWDHRGQPVTHGDRAELWHTRLRRRDNPRADPSIRAVYTPDLQIVPPHGHQFPLSAEERKKIVRLSADWTLRNANPPYTPEPVEADELMLTTLGGFLRVRGAWNAPPQLNLDLALWRQTTTLARDHKVMAVTRGRLFPWGHRAVKIKVVEREVSTSPDVPLAALRKREFIVVTEAERNYADQPYINGGREMPFTAGVRVLTSTTPDLKLNPALDIVTPGEVEPAFWVRTADGLYDFDISAIDPTDRRATWAAPLIWVPEKLINNTTRMNMIADAYTAASTRRSVDVAGQAIALTSPANGAAAGTGLAAATGGQEISLAAERLKFSLQKRILPNGVLSILPQLESAKVRIPAVEQMLGISEALEVELYEEYLKHGLQSAQNAAAVYAKLMTSQLPNLDLPVEKAGGLAAAVFEVRGISERLGPVLGDLNELAQGNFGPQSLKGLADSKLLGTISLLNLIEQITGLSGFDKQLPALGTEIERDAVGVPTAVTNRLRWTPKIRSVSPFVASLRDTTATLTIDTSFRQEVAGGAPDYEIKGVLSNFHIDFGGVLAVNFRELRFESIAGKKPDVVPLLDEVEPITFRGALEFLDKLREKIPFDGFSDPPALDISSRGIDVSYSLGLPPLSFGAFNLQNVTLGADLFLPFVDEAARLRFNFAERHSPFQLAVLAITGGGFLALEVALNRIVALEAALEFGGSVVLNLGVAKGGVYIMGGVYFALKTGQNESAASTELTAYLRAGGYLSVLGLVTISADFYMELRHDFNANELHGQATVRYKVRIAFWSKTVKITLERRFAGPPRRNQAALMTRAGERIAALDDNLSFGDGMTEADWQAYVRAFA